MSRRSGGPQTVPYIPAQDAIRIDSGRPSSVRVFGKSLYMLAGGWLGSILWLWLAGLRQHVFRFGTTPEDFAVSLLAAGVAPALALGVLAGGLGKLTGVAVTAAQEKLEWWHAFWWALFPNLCLLAAAYLVIFGTD